LVKIFDYVPILRTVSGGILAGRFNFRFTSVLTLRREQEEKIKMEMSPVVQKYNACRQLISDLQNNLHLFNREKEKYFKAPKQLAYFTEMIKYYRNTINATRTRLKEIDKQFLPLKKKLKQAVMKRKAIEKIREKDFVQYKKELQKEKEKEVENNAVALRVNMKL